MIDLNFVPIRVSRRQLVTNALRYVGLPYNRGLSFIERADNGTVSGYCNCYGLLLAVAIDCQLLPQDFDINLAPGNFNGQTPAKTLWQIIHLNFDDLRGDYSDMKAGDLILMRYRDVDPHLTEPHHVALCVAESEPLELFEQPQMIHAYEKRAGTGIVRVTAMDELIMKRVESVWRMKNLRD